MVIQDPIVVCVDDDPDMLAAVVRTLKREPIHIMQTTDPNQALTWVAAHQVAVLLSDYEMPQMTGVELASAARKVRPETVRILLTGKRTLDTAVEGINRGEVFRFINKPFEPEALKLAISDGVARHRELAAIVGDRELAARRERLVIELEVEFPSITKVDRDGDGVYTIPPTAFEAVAGMGLDAVSLLGRR
jgi:DNA-binding NtrC family response regulator